MLYEKGNWMTNFDIARCMVLQTLHARIDTPVERMCIQRKVYFLQESGVQLGFFYAQGVDGPFSGDLADFLSENKSVIQYGYFEGRTLKPNVLDRIRQANTLYQ